MIVFLKSFLRILSVTSLLVGTIIGAGILRSNSGLPKQTAHFNDAPIVVVCSSSQYSREDIMSGLKYWEDLGYEFFSVIYDFNCDLNTTIEGGIVIDIAGQNFNQDSRNNTDRLGKTRIVYIKEIREIKSSRIEILVSAERVLEHEIGHSLGWDHVNKPGHIMNPIISSGGWDSDGLEAKTEG